MLRRAIQCHESAAEAFAAGQHRKGRASVGRACAWVLEYGQFIRRTRVLFDASAFSERSECADAQQRSERSERARGRKMRRKGAGKP